MVKVVKKENLAVFTLNLESQDLKPHLSIPDLPRQVSVKSPLYGMSSLNEPSSVKSTAVSPTSWMIMQACITLFFKGFVDPLHSIKRAS